ncbi:MAG: PTS sugar transporter subunit IIA [Verrucomicrobia bacterium]|nr:PTS sugar transporter subunit IIA [Verrucomicrobiota bacterium]MBU4289629.1 PTS sugar transporter subunit IIA [Verrucomicrobiota bacterium]MBU4430146.1 PTS sugar transporter subunit IIA [Verrucomicrobiota bacterium]MCG2679493.1 PTS sugar transporter subunit IIA [Kiritimatiellia bacterium]
MQLSVRDVAEILQVSEKTIYRWIKQDGLPSCLVNDQVRLNRAELLEWATSRRMNLPLDLFSRSQAEPEILPSLTGALEAGGIFHQVQGADKPALLQAIIACMPLPAGVDREFMIRMLLAREALASTGVGEGIAIPHPRNPISLHVSCPLVTLCFPEHPVDFGALDGQPVYALFTLVSPAPKVHLHMLAHLFYAIRQPEFKALLVRRAPAVEIHEALRRIEATIPSHTASPGVGPA